jgi:hypothetical protein
MLILGLALGVVIAVLLERITQQPKKPGKINPVQRAQVLAVTAVVLAVALGVSLAKTPVVGQALDEGVDKAAGFVTARYQGDSASDTTQPHKPKGRGQQP